MNQYIYKLLIFSSPLFLLIVAVFALNYFCANYEVDYNKKVLIVGHSHSECAFNDSIIHGTVNFSQSGESYFYTYFKVKQLLRQNPHLTTVFIACTNNQFSKEMDEWIWDDRHMIYRFPKYALFMNNAALRLLIKKNPSSFKRCLPLILRNSIKMIFYRLNYTETLGRYLSLPNEYDGQDPKNKKEDLYQEYSEPSEWNVAYLHNLIELCEENGVAVCLVRTPLHADYLGFSNELAFKDMLKNRFPNTQFFDFSQFPLNNHDFADPEHLNSKGARKFSLYFNNIISNYLLETKNNELDIDK